MRIATFPGDCVGTLSAHDGGVVGLQVGSSGQVIYTTCFDGFARVWDARTLRQGLTI